MILGFTGTRAGLTTLQRRALEQVVADAAPDVVVHGCCIGADAEFDTIAAALGILRHGRPSDMPGLTFRPAGKVVLHPAKRPLERNRDIVEACDELVACPGAVEVRRSGTWATVRLARRLRKLISIVLPSGVVEVEDHREEG